MKVIGKDRTSCDVCNPIDEILARLDALERRASAIVAKVQGIAPDGEGNVALPTSSSDTDPLHGRMDAFAMSSEVKEAADDAHAYAASIADDVLVINSEIDALNQAVAALQPAEIEAIKSAVQTLQTTVATLESTVATLNSSVAGKVSKSGDTMSGTLTIQKGLPDMYFTNIHNDFSVPATAVDTTHYLAYLDKNGQDTFHISEYVFKGGRGMAFALRSKTTGEIKEANLGLIVEDNGVVYATAPSWSPGTNDNSSKILTIKMANSLPSLVHTTGNETIAGSKTFASRIVEQKSSDMGMEMLSTSFDRSATFTSYQRPVQFIARDKNGDSVLLLQTYAESNNRRGLDLMLYDMNGNHCELSLKSDGSKTYASAPTTPTNASGTEIATANWVLTKINELATKNNLAGL